MEETKQFSVTHRGNKYNIYKFLNNHPGGANYVKPYKEKEITKRMEHFQHSKAAYYLLREYKTGGRDISPDAAQEDLEALVDWDKPMLSQLPSLGAKYNEWVISPVDRKLRLFGNPILECFSLVPWYVVPLIWIPIMLFVLNYGINKYVRLTQDPSPILPTILSFLSGMVLWTLIEYSVHRWIFHIKPSGNSKAMIIFHFAIHGLHHKVPFDSLRLVFPPVPAFIIAYIIYFIICLFVPACVLDLIMAGVITGYLIYDMIHFYLHHGSPKENSRFYQLKRYHIQHHFAHHDSGFGISNRFWDIFFGTAIKLKQLAKAIRW